MTQTRDNSLTGRMLFRLSLPDRLHILSILHGYLHPGQLEIRPQISTLHTTHKHFWSTRTVMTKDHLRWATMWRWEITVQPVCDSNPEHFANRANALSTELTGPFTHSLPITRLHVLNLPPCTAHVCCVLVFGINITEQLRILSFIIFSVPYCFNIYRQFIALRDRVNIVE